MRLIGYVRVSTDEQAIVGCSLNAQKDRIQQYATLYMHEITYIEDAGYSAKSLDRPGIQKAFKMMHTKEADGILVLKLDRLTRSVRDLTTIIEITNKNHLALISISEQIDTSTAAGRMFLMILGTIAQWERETTGERVSIIINNNRRLGHVYSSRWPLYGYKKDGKLLVPVPSEQEIIKYIMSRGSVATSVQICKELTDRGMSTRTGGPWHPKVVLKIIKDQDKRADIDSGSVSIHAPAKGATLLL
jgi:site-specific DNA recombinase